MNANGSGTSAAGDGLVFLSTFLTELLGLTGYALVPGQCGRRDGVWVIAVTPAFVERKCDKCGSLNIKMHTPYVRNIAHVPVGSKRTRLRIVVPRNYCKDCRQTSTPDLPQALPCHRVSLDLLDFMLDRYQSRQTYAQIAFDSGSSERSVARVIHEVVTKIDAARKIALVLPASVGIDDIRFWRGEDGIWSHIVHPDAGQTIDVVQGTSAAHVQFFWGGAKDVSAVTKYSSDGAVEYVGIGKDNFPHALRTLNRFHVVKYMLEGLDAVRAEAFPELNTQETTQIPLIDVEGDELEKHA